MIKCYFCEDNFKSKSAYINHLKNRKIPCIDDKKLWENQKNIVLNNFLKNNITFDKNQIKFINSKLDDCKLLGIPGGGKTRCIIEKIKKCFENKIFNNNFDFLILTFSKRSRLNIFSCYRW